MAYSVAEAANSFAVDADSELRKLGSYLKHEEKHKFKLMIEAAEKLKNTSKFVAKPLYDIPDSEMALSDSDWLYAFLKLLIPFIVVVPGIAAYVMVNDPATMARLGASAMENLPGLGTADRAYPWLLHFLPAGLTGLAFAALAAAIVSSLASMLNSTSTIFTMDIYKQYINKNASDKATVNMGRISASVALIIAVIMAPLLGGIDQAFQFIQEYTGVVSPGILAVFILGLFWKKTTNKAAIWGAILSIPIAMFFKVGPKSWAAGSGMESMFPTLPWMDQMGYTALLTMLLIIVISLFQNKGQNDDKGIPLNKELFKTSPLFNICSFAILILLVVVYALFWK